jgi:hypothetical protein
MHGRIPGKYVLISKNNAVLEMEKLTTTFSRKNNRKQ